MLILSLLIGSGFAVLCAALLWLVPDGKKITSEKESFEESSRRRDRYIDEMRRDRLLNAEANKLRAAVSIQTETLAMATHGGNPGYDA